MFIIIFLAVVFNVILFTYYKCINIYPYSSYLPGGIEENFKILKSDKTFNDILGNTKLKEDLKNSLDKLTTKTLATGYVFYGPPGNGKSLMLRAATSYSKYPCIDIDDVIVNNRKELKRVMDYLKRFKCPAVILLDDEGDTSWKAIHFIKSINALEDLRGFLFLVSTNETPATDNPLYRSGRFDKLINFCNPMYEERERYFIKQGFDEKEASLYASYTSKKSYADLYRLSQSRNFREELIKINHQQINLEFTLTPQQRERVAYHEVGHLIIARLYNIPTLELTLKPRGTAVGMVIFGDWDKVITTTTEVMGFFRSCLGGYAAERLFLNETSTLSNDDFVKAKKIFEILRENCMIPVITWDIFLTDQLRIVMRHLEEYKAFFDLLVKEVLEKDILFTQEIDQLLEYLPTLKFKMHKV